MQRNKIIIFAADFRGEIFSLTEILTRCGVEQRQLVGLITRRSEVRILPPLHKEISLAEAGLISFFMDKRSSHLTLFRLPPMVDSMFSVPCARMVLISPLPVQVPSMKSFPSTKVVVMS